MVGGMSKEPSKESSQKTTLAVIVILVAAFAAKAVCSDSGKQDNEVTREAVSEIQEIEPEEPKPPTAEDVRRSLMARFMAEEDVEKAFAFAKGDMRDTVNEISGGTAMFSMWAAKYLFWRDVHRSKNETSIGKIKKDSSTEIGKRMCLRGKIISIARDKSVADPLFTGLVMTRKRDVVNFVAVGDTGELVEDSRARFCGIVTGNYSYSNAGGGTTHSVNLVGMFDLAENKH